VDALNSFYSSEDGVMFNKSQTLLIQFPGGIDGSYTIPNSVTNVGDSSFAYSTRLTSVTIPNTITSIDNDEFAYCTSLTCVKIPSSVTTIGNFAFHFCTSLYRVTIPNGVTSIGEHAFHDCFSLPSVTIPKSVISIGGFAFYGINGLTGVYFEGNAPRVGAYVFLYANNVTVYYLPGTTGWRTTFADRPTVLWNPLVETGDALFGVRTNQFGFTITGTSNLVIVVEASANLVNPTWTPVGTNTLTGGSSYFSDPTWTKNHPARFYRLRPGPTPPTWPPSPAR
jgi:hypothetical protein